MTVFASFLRGRKSNFNFFCSFKKTWFHLTEEKMSGKKHFLAIFQSRYFWGFYPAFNTGIPELESQVTNPHEDDIGLVSEIFSNL